MKQISGVSTAYVTINGTDKMCELNILTVKQEITNIDGEIKDKVKEKLLKVTLSKSSAESLRNTLNVIIDKLSD